MNALRSVHGAEPENRLYVWSNVRSMCVRELVTIPPHSCLVLASDCVHSIAENSKSEYSILGYCRLQGSLEILNVEPDKASVLEEVY